VQLFTYIYCIKVYKLNSCVTGKLAKDEIVHMVQLYTSYCLVSAYSVFLSFTVPSYATMIVANETTSTISSSLTFSADELPKAEYSMDYVLGKVFIIT